MLRALLALAFVLLLAISWPAQPAVQKIVDAEHAFAKRAIEVGDPQAFVEFMTADAWAFTPEAVNAKTYWSAQKRGDSVLEWAPNFADAASDGTFGYTTGNWQLRPRAGGDPTSFGEFNTIWVKQRDGSYKWIVDIGAGHDKPAKYSTKVIVAEVSGGRHPSPPQSDMSRFDELAGKDVRNAYGKFSGSNIRMIRRGKLPVIGSAAVALEVSGSLIFGTPIASQRASDMSFVLRPYTLGSEHGNQLQVWKYDHKLAGWTIVLDVLKPLPSK